MSVRVKTTKPPSRPVHQKHTVSQRHTNRWAEPSPDKIMKCLLMASCRVQRPLSVTAHRPEVWWSACGLVLFFFLPGCSLTSSSDSTSEKWSVVLSRAPSNMQTEAAGQRCAAAIKHPGVRWRRGGVRTRTEVAQCKPRSLNAVESTSAGPCLCVWQGSCCETSWLWGKCCL